MTDLIINFQKVNKKSTYSEISTCLSRTDCEDLGLEFNLSELLTEDHLSLVVPEQLLVFKVA